MILLGLTGGVAMGKSTAGAFFEAVGVPVADADVLARQAVEPGQPALDEIRIAFGAEVIDASGHLRRREVAQRVFSDPSARSVLESILHPRIRSGWKTQAESWRRAGRPLGVVVIPLLFETGAEQEFDVVACVACTGATQGRRLRERGWSEAEAAQRIAAQWPADRKIAMAHCVVWTEGVLAATQEQLRRLQARLPPS